MNSCCQNMATANLIPLFPRPTSQDSCPQPDFRMFHIPGSAPLYHQLRMWGREAPNLQLPFCVTAAKLNVICRSGILQSQNILASISEEIRLICLNNDHVKKVSPVLANHVLHSFITADKNRERLFHLIQCMVLQRKISF